MANNHKYRPYTRRSQRKQTPSLGWLWLTSGILVGVVGTTLLYIWKTNPQYLFDVNLKSLFQSKQPLIKPPEETLDKLSRHSNHAKAQVKKTKNNPAQRFEFYQLLPGMEVAIPDNTEVTASNVILTPKSTSKPVTPSVKKTQPSLAKTKSAPLQKKLAAAQYIIQAGAYRQSHEAEHLIQRLRNKGILSRIQKVEAEDGTWYRVMLGPFTTETMALKQKKRLTQQKIHSILILQR